MFRKILRSNYSICHKGVTLITAFSLCCPVHVALAQQINPNTSLSNSFIKAVDNSLVEMRNVGDPPNGPCPGMQIERSKQTAKDSCGTTIPESEFEQIHIRFQNAVDTKNSDERAKQLLSLAQEMEAKHPGGAAEIASLALQAEGAKAMSIATKYLPQISVLEAQKKDKSSTENDYKKSLKEKLGWSDDQINEFTNNFQKTELSKNLNELAKTGLYFNAEKGELGQGFPSLKKPIETLNTKAISDPKNANLANAIKSLVGEDALKKLQNPNRREAVSLGGLMVTPPRYMESNKAKGVAVITKKDWEDSITRNLDHLNTKLTIIKNNVPELEKAGFTMEGSIVAQSADWVNSWWGGAKFPTPHKKKVEAHFEEIKQAQGFIEGLERDGLDPNIVKELHNSVLTLSSSSAGSVEKAYNNCVAYRQQAFMIAGAAAVLAVPGANAILLSSISGWVGGSLTAASVVSYGANLALGASRATAEDGKKATWGQWACHAANEASKTAGSFVAQTLLMSVVPGGIIAKLGNGGKLAKATAVTLGAGLIVAPTAWNAKEIWGGVKKCWNRVIPGENPPAELEQAAASPEELDRALQMQSVEKLEGLMACFDTVNILAGSLLGVKGMLDQHRIQQATNKANKTATQKTKSENSNFEKLANDPHIKDRLAEAKGNKDLENAYDDTLMLMSRADEVTRVKFMDRVKNLSKEKLDQLVEKLSKSCGGK